MTSSSGLAIPLGAPYSEQAQEFLSYLLRPAQQARIAELAGVGPANLEAQPAWSENGAKVNAFGPANTGTSVAVDPAWWSQNWSDASTKFNTWRTPPPAA
jgi:putative spermidine/putrescine transport system substrate-binding protein